MAFVLTLPPNAELETDLVEKGDEHVGFVKIGFDNRTGVTYTLELGLSPAMLYWPNAYELYFLIRYFDPRDRSTGEFRDGSDTRHIITSKNDREALVAAIAGFSCSLVLIVQPETIFIQTRLALPLKALFKYWMTALALQEHGYDVDPMEPYHGRHSWKLTRIA